jgi:ABC-type glycerol-3-phosphate transport system substrate-binding protein
MKRALSLLTAFALMATIFGTIPVSADTDAAAAPFSPGDAGLTYMTARGAYRMPAYRGADVAVDVGASLTTGDPVTVAVSVPEDGLYEIWMTYRNSSRQVQILPTELSMTIDGLIPFAELRRLKFESLWLNNSPASTDRFGNEMPPILAASGEFVSKALEDSSHRLSGPILFELGAGIRTFTFTSADGSIEIADITLKAPRQIPAYRAAEAPGDILLTYMGQEFASANVSSIRAAGEYNPILTPYSSSTRVLNFLDDGSFSRAGSRVDYQIDIPEAGYYRLALNYRQGAKNGFPVFIDILVNGEIPSEAAQAVPFDFARNFTQFTVPAPDGTAQSFYFERGTHTLSLVINAEPLAHIYAGVDVILNEISDLTTEIIRLTGGDTPDPHRDYRLSEYIPDLAGRLLRWADECDAMADSMLEYTDGVPSGVFSMLPLSARMLRRLARRPEDLPRRLNELSRGPSSVTSFLAQSLSDMDNHAFGIDLLFVYQDGASLPRQPGFFTVFFENIRRFFISFVRRDYAMSGGSEENLQVWMARSRQFVELLQNMIDTEFTPQYGVGVDLSIMPDQSKLALAAASGQAPDVALSVGYVLPSYLNIRGALLDLKPFDDFPEVAERFPSGLFVPGIYDGGVYAVPETINFWVMFYRTDIFGALNIPVPDNMDEVKAILPELQRRSMNFFFPTAGMIGMKIFPGTLPLILQTGGSIFGDNIWNTTLDSEESLAGFRAMTDLFTVFDMPVEVPAPGFYQRFRSGTLPIGISDVGTYNLLMNSAPELEGSWAIAPFPGLVDEEGNVRRYTTGGAESCIIFSTTERPGDSWRFLEWWTRGDVQARFGTTLASLYGGEFLWNTANKEAFAQLPIPSEHKAVILAQTEWMVECPWVPGTYMVERELSNAFNRVVVDGMTVRRAMDEAVKRIDREVFRKLEEFGYTRNGVSVRDFVTPHESVLWR